MEQWRPGKLMHHSTLAHFRNSLGPAEPPTRQGRAIHDSAMTESGGFPFAIRLDNGIIGGPRRRVPWT